MKGQRGFARWLPGLLLISCVGCLVSEAPLVKPDDAIKAEALYGTWLYEAKPDSNVRRVTFIMRQAGEAFPKNTLYLKSIVVNQAGDESWQESFAYIGKLGEQEYLHVVSFGDAGRAGFKYSDWANSSNQNVVIFQIQREQDSFQLFNADQQKVGTVLSRDPSVRLAASEVAKIRETLEKKGPTAIFQEDQAVIFKRQPESE